MLKPCKSLKFGINAFTIVRVEQFPVVIGRLKTVFYCQFVGTEKFGGNWPLANEIIYANLKQFYRLFKPGFQLMFEFAASRFVLQTPTKIKK